MDKEGNPVTFAYSCFADSLEEQAKQQGYKLEKAEMLEELKKALSMIRIHGILTYSETDRATMRLHKLVCKNLIPLEDITDGGTDV